MGFGQDPCTMFMSVGSLLVARSQDAPSTHVWTLPQSRDALSWHCACQFFFVADPLALPIDIYPRNSVLCIVVRRGADSGVQMRMVRRLWILLWDPLLGAWRAGDPIGLARRR